MLIGYARVSKTDGSQSLDLQRDALRAAGIDDAANVYHDFASGVRDDRPGLDSCLRALRKGDVLVVWKLDRLGRNLAHLVNTVQDLSARGVGLRVDHRARYHLVLLDGRFGLLVDAVVDQCPVDHDGRRPLRQACEIDGCADRVEVSCGGVAGDQDEVRGACREQGRVRGVWWRVDHGALCARLGRRGQDLWQSAPVRRGHDRGVRLPQVAPRRRRPLRVEVHEQRRLVVCLACDREAARERRLPGAGRASPRTGLAEVRTEIRGGNAR